MRKGHAHDQETPPLEGAAPGAPRARRADSDVHEAAARAEGRHARALSGPLTLVRISRKLTTSAALWRLLEARVRAACPVISPTTPPEQLLVHARGYWDRGELMLGAWLAMDGDHAVAHALGWVDTFWGQPYLLIYHVACDPGVSVRSVGDRLLREFGRWALAIDDQYLRGGHPWRIGWITFYTERPAAWTRYLRARGITPQQRLTGLDLAPLDCVEAR